MEKKTNLKLSTRLLVLLCLMGIGLIIASVCSILVSSMGLLAMLTVQDVLAFIIPAIAAMAIFYHRPLHVMGYNRRPKLLALMVVIVFYVASMPAMNWLVEANNTLSLPSWMSGLEQMMRTLEDSAAETTQKLLDIGSVGQLVACLFTIGFMAGLSEETLFRGAMLRTMQDSRLGTHAAVWVTAVVFSAIHLQFFGFFPRMLLGAWLGYLLVWSRSLWLPIIAHTLNNSSVVMFSYLANKGVVAEDFGDKLGLPSAGAFPWLALLSLAVCLIIAIGAHHYQERLR